jgi:hypothetical protein
MRSLSGVAWKCSGLTPIVMCLVLFMGCETTALHELLKKEQQEEVEVAPGKWLTVQRTDWCYDDADPSPIKASNAGERTRLVMTWNAETVTWEGVAIPISLREWEGKLYLIGFDRETDRDKPMFRYYRQTGRSFEEIAPADFPKRIATQNMWLKADSYSIGMDGKRHYDLEMARQLDPTDVYFNDSLTAQIWAHLSTGKDYHEQDPQVDEETLTRYKEAYKPIPLPTIIKTASELGGEK